jgi:hypothetical protein
MPGSVGQVHPSPPYFSSTYSLSRKVQGREYGSFTGPHYAICRIDQITDLGSTVMRGHPPTLVAQKILPTFKTHSGGSQPTAESVFQIVHPLR